MKVLVVAHESEFVGGANRALFAILKYWVDNSLVEYEVLLPSAQGRCIKELDKWGIKYHVVNYYKTFSELREHPLDCLRRVKTEFKFLYNQVAAKKISKKIKNNEYQLVYSNTRMTSIGAYIARELGIPHVMHIREFGNENTFWGRANIEWIYNNSTHIITISHELKKYLTRTVGEEKFSVSYDGVSYFHNVNIEDNQKTTINLLVTGRIAPAKAQDEAIHALKILSDKGLNNIILHFAGSIAGKSKYETEYFKCLKKLIKEYGLDNRIIFHGEVKNMKLLREQMDVELMCALKETFGWVTVEGMRSGLLVIGGNTGATPEIIKDRKTGLIYQQGNPADLAKKIKWAVDNPESVLRIRRDAYEYSYKNFTVEENAKDILTVFDDVLRRKNI